MMVGTDELKPATVLDAVVYRQKTVGHTSSLSTEMMTGLVARQVIQQVLNAVMVDIEPSQLVSEPLLDEVDCQRHVLRRGHRLSCT